MISATAFRDIVSGRRRGWSAALCRSAFLAASVPYGWVIRRRNRQYDRGRAAIHRPPVPVISVGNLTVGGTGKTPMVEWIARHARQHDIRVAILSRGYGAEQGGLNDEALELELALPDVPHLQNPDRVASAGIAVEELASQLLVLDDGFQHRRLARDVDIVLIDASEPFGFDRLLPRGTLREPVEGLRRAQVVALSRADMLDEAARSAVRQRVLQHCPEAAWCEVQHQPAKLINSAGQKFDIQELRGANVAAFCGIGNPAGFRHTLSRLGCQVVDWREFPDHHAYSRQDVDELQQWVRRLDVSTVICTRKDLVKLRTPAIGGAPLRAVEIALEFLSGEAETHRALAGVIAQSQQSNTAMFEEPSVDGPAASST